MQEEKAVLRLHRCASLVPVEECDPKRTLLYRSALGIERWMCQPCYDSLNDTHGWWTVRADSFPKSLGPPETGAPSIYKAVREAILPYCKGETCAGVTRPVSPPTRRGVD